MSSIFSSVYILSLFIRVGSVAELLDAEEMCGGATDDYYFSTQSINLTYTVVFVVVMAVVLLMVVMMVTIIIIILA